MKKDTTYYEALMQSYFAGEADQKEMAELNDWLHAKPENKKVFQEYRKTWVAVNRVSVDKRIETHQEWKSIHSKIHKSSTKILPIWKNKKALAIAASVAILISAFFILQYLVFNVNQEKILAENGIENVLLPDGTTVTLNQGAKLIYPEEFEKQNREVELFGEAFFEVQKKTDHPFIVKFKNSRIEVLGTSFLVISDKEKDHLEVVLQEGKLAVYFKKDPHSKILMNPDEKVGVSIKEQMITRKPNTNPNYLSWKSKEFVFENTSLKEVFTLLEDAYHKKIILENPALASCRLTAEFRDQSLESILKVLQATFEIRLTIKPNLVMIEGKGCD